MTGQLLLSSSQYIGDAARRNGLSERQQLVKKVGKKFTGFA